MTINGTVFTCVASVATGNQCNTRASIAATLTALAVVLNASVVAGVLLANYVGTATTPAVTYKTLGLTGNTFTLGMIAGECTPILSTRCLGNECSIRNSACLPCRKLQSVVKRPVVFSTCRTFLMVQGYCPA